MTTATNTSAAQALKHDVCNIMAVKVGTYLKPRSSFLMRVNVTYDDINTFDKRAIYGFSFKTMKFTELDKSGYCEWLGETSSLEQVEGSPALFMLRLDVHRDPVPIKVLININKRVYEDVSLLGLTPADGYAIAVSFSDSDVYDGGDEYSTGDWTYHDPDKKNKEAEDEFNRDVEENPGAYGVEVWNY